MNKLSNDPIINTVTLWLLALVLPGLLLCANAGAGEMAGKTIIAKGNVHAGESESAIQRKLKRRSPVFDVDVIKTAANSKAQLRMVDGGMIALKENSELRISAYHFDAGQQKGSVAMELIKGGLRSVTGAIKAEKGNYKLITPVGSIGIRGTHYELEMVGSELFIAVWDGAIDVSLDVGAGEQPQNLSLGTSEDYAYASVDEAGTITPLLEPPAAFAQGHSSDPEPAATEPATSASNDNSGEGEGEPTPTDEGAPSSTPTEEETTAATESAPEPESEPEPEIVAVPESEPEPEYAPADGFDTEVEVEVAQEEAEEFIPAPNLGELVLAKTGTVVYNQISDLGITNLAGGGISGNLDDFQASMAVNFDNATVSDGNLSFSDDGGEWFAAFNGIINVDQFEVDVNFASHGDQRADGDIEALFIGDLDNIFVNFKLFEINDNNIGVQGNFTFR